MAELSASYVDTLLTPADLEPSGPVGATLRDYVARDRVRRMLVTAVRAGLVVEMADRGLRRWGRWWPIRFFTVWPGHEPHGERWIVFHVNDDNLTAPVQIHLYDDTGGRRDLRPHEAENLIRDEAHRLRDARTEE